MATRFMTREGERASLGFIVLLVKILIFFGLKLPLIILLLLFGRKSLALFLWGKGRIMTWIAKRNDADPGMYRRERWKRFTRAKVYERNQRENDGYFRCEVTGVRSTSLAGFHVDHRLSRSHWPLLAYNQDNLRLVTAKVNMKKSDNLHWWSFLKFIVLKRC